MRDTAGKVLPKETILKNRMLPYCPLVGLPWAAIFLAVGLQAVILAGDLVGVFAGRPPIFVAFAVVAASDLFLELPFRVLWRAPVKEEGPE